MDTLQKIEATGFDEAWDNRLETLIDGELPTHVISPEHLIKNKLAVGRPQDLIDAAKVRQALSLRSKS